MLSEVLNLYAAIIDVALSEVREDAAESSARETRRQRRKERRGDPEAPGAFWKKTIPRTRPYINYVLDYCREQHVRVDINGRHLWTGDAIQLTPRADALVIAYSQKWADGPDVLKSAAVPYPGGPSGRFARLCRGERVQYGARLYAQVDPGKLMFSKGMDGDRAIITFDEFEVFFDGPLFLDAKGRLRQIALSQSGAEIDMTGLIGLVAPDIAWGD